MREVGGCVRAAHKMSFAPVPSQGDMGSPTAGHVVCTGERRKHRHPSRIPAMDAHRKVELFLERPIRRGRTGATHKGALVIIGGHEDRSGDKQILRAVADRLGKDGKIVVCTVASEQPQSLWDEYESAFRSLGVPHVYRLDIESREEASSARAIRILEGATGVFFTGGDQLKI